MNLLRRFAPYALGLAISIWAGAAMAQGVKLLFVTLSPPGGTNSEFFTNWVHRVNESSQGSLDIQVRDGQTLANFGNVMDRITDDVVQMGWVLPGAIGNQFPLTSVSSMPFEGSGDNIVASVAMWRLYKSGLLDAEYKQIVPLFFGATGNSAIHFHKPPKSVEDLIGLKISSTNRENSKLVQALGGSPMSLSPADVYEALQRGTIDGVVMGWSGFSPYKLFEVTTYHLDGPFGNAAYFVGISRNRYDALSPAARKAIDNLSGEAASRDYGTFIKTTEDTGRQSAKGSEIVELTPSQRTEWEKKAASAVVAGWVKEVPGRDRVLDAFIKDYRDIKAGH